ncbi:alpha/beta hydrolase [Porticoccaceae bacterium]|jgi:acetyl esterase|nr:alpha/beta hydrolase [Porticoccaceae bacterium]|tara:strand:- start:3524 stop:4438 length:915 start_codon:yes stop_codon:yes gene_type:complete
MSLHPFINAMLENSVYTPGLSAGTPEQGRAIVAEGRNALGTGPDMERISDIEIPAREGPLRARLFVPSTSPIGLIVYLHGGGWVLAAIEDFDTYARALAAESNCAVLLPDYRLAPEHPFPAGLKDAEDALRWAATDHLGLGNLPLILAGDSAGANLAAVIARKSDNTVQLALQILYYPITDCNFDTDSYRRHGDGLTLTKKDMEWFFGHYAPRSGWIHPDISPLLATDLSEGPPAVVVVAEYDVLATEGMAYANKLRDAGVHVTERRLKGLTHGFIRLHNLLEPARDELSSVARNIAAACNSDN